MHNQLKKILIVAMIALPTLTNAAENSPAAEPKNTAPAPAALIAPPVTAADAKTPKTAVASQNLKLGYVDSARIGSDSDRGKSLKTALEAKKEGIQTKIDNKKKQLEKLKASIEAKLSSMTPQQREAKSKEFQKKFEELQKLARTSEEEFYKYQEKETKAFIDEIEQAAAAYGKANDFSAIVIKKDLLYLGSAVDVQDVTDALIKSLNATGQKK